MNKPKKIKEMWVNVYNDIVLNTGFVYPSYEQARALKEVLNYIGTYQLIKKGVKP